MQAKIALTESEILSAIQVYISSQTGLDVDANEIKIEVKSKQNYRSEWEQADIRCEFNAKVRT